MNESPFPAPARRYQPGLIRRIPADPAPVLDEVSERYGSMCGFGAGPLRFDPDRFLAPSDDQKNLADIAWVPFGRGARNCIGFALAQMELTLIVARIAQRLDITSTASEIPPPVGMVVNRPAGGAPMHVSARRP